MKFLISNFRYWSFALMGLFFALFFSFFPTKFIVLNAVTISVNLIAFVLNSLALYNQWRKSHEVSHSNR